MNRYLSLIGLFVLHNICFAQSSFYDVNTIQKIAIFSSLPNWDFRLETLKAGSDNYLMMDSVKINGYKLETVGIKYKGNSSYNPAYVKNPIHIALDEFKSQNYHGITDIKLGNNYADPSMMREVLAYNILNKYMDCPRSNFAAFYINNVYIGLYANDEPIDKKFCGDKFSSSSNTLIKCNPIVNPGTASRCNMKFINADSSSYFNFYELKSKSGWNKFVKLCDTITNYPNSISKNIDIDRSLWMLAFNNATVNLDSYTGAFVQNYYLYEDKYNRFNPIVWDLNMAFGGFQFAGTQGAGGFGILTLAGMQNMSPVIHSNETDWPLIKNTLSNASYKKKYFAHLKTILKENFQNNDYINTYTNFKLLIDTAVIADTNKFFSNAIYQNALDSTLPSGSKTPGIRTLMNARLAFLNSYADIAAIAPSFTSTALSKSNPTLGESITISATISSPNTASVFFNYRSNTADHFQTMQLFDDGNHNDGLANDFVFAASCKVNAANTQYYFYAENADAGIFSPERVEHEFYNLSTTVLEPIAHDLVINEFLADNLNGNRDEYNQREDWIELFNNSNKLINLSNLYLTDDKTKLNKWKFPANTSILPGAFLIVWADDDSTQKIFHTNFNLNKDSGFIALSDGLNNIIDSISYNAQLTDKSAARIPNGTGSFVIGNPSFEKNNNSTNIYFAQADNSLLIYPNPVKDMLQIQSEKSIREIAIFNALGIKLDLGIDIHQKQVNMASLTEGVYYIAVKTDSGSYIGKIIKEN